MHPAAKIRHTPSSWEGTSIENVKPPHRKDTAVYQAYFQAGKNIGDIEVLLSVAAQAGLDPQAVQTHRTEGTYSVSFRQTCLTSPLDAQ